MTNYTDLFPKDLYHSYIVEGDPVTQGILVRTFLEQRGDIETNSPDVLCQMYDSFTIDDSTFIQEWHSKKGITDGKKICILAAKFINHEAERALLKMFEEPKHNTHFFLVVPRASMLLDTIRSRAHIIYSSRHEDISLLEDTHAFLRALPKERIEIVARMIENTKNSETNGTLRYNALSFVNELERTLYEKFKKNKNEAQTIFALKELENARLYLSTPGAGVKMILEHIALVL
jgi:hypothetical protein